LRRFCLCSLRKALLRRRRRWGLLGSLRASTFLYFALVHFSFRCLSLPFLLRFPYRLEQAVQASDQSFHMIIKVLQSVDLNCVAICKISKFVGKFIRLRHFRIGDENRNNGNILPEGPFNFYPDEVHGLG
jgi:hypothetical protein